MKRIIIGALVALTALGGVASADRGWRGRDVRHSQGGVTVAPSRGYYNQRPAYNRGHNRSYDRGHNRSYNRGYYVQRPTYRYVRRPIYVQRPVIRYRYVNYYQQPQVLVENYPARAGYYWVAGKWIWTGYEWSWQAGYYAPDPNATDYYSNTQSSEYYENPSYDPNYAPSYDYNNGY